jgi:hypothetical protein
MRVESENLLFKFGPKLAKLIRINPVKGYNSVYGVDSVRFTDYESLGQEPNANKPEIIYLQTTAKEGINMIY